MKPKPPSDLWTQMDNLRQESSLINPPDNSFTVQDYRMRYGVNQNAASRDVQKLLADGKIKLVENCRKRCYVLVEQ